MSGAGAGAEAGAEVFYGTPKRPRAGSSYDPRPLEQRLRQAAPMALASAPVTSPPGYVLVAAPPQPAPMPPSPAPRLQQYALPSTPPTSHSEVQRLKVQLQCLQSEVVRLGLELKAEQEAKSQAEARAYQAQQQTQGYVRSVQAYQAENQANLKKFQATLEGYNTANNDLCRDVEQAQAQVIEKSKEINAKERELTQSKTENSRLRQEIRKAQAQVGEKKKEIKRMEKEHTATLADMREALTRETKRADAAVLQSDVLAKRYAAQRTIFIENANQKHQQALVVLQAALQQQFQTNFEKFSTEMNSKHKASLAKKEEQIREIQGQQAEACQLAENQKTRHKQQIEAKGARIVKLETALGQKEKDIAGLRAQCTTLGAQIGKDLRVKDKRIEELEQEKEDLKENYTKQANLALNYCSVIDVLKAKLKDQEAAAAMLLLHNSTTQPGSGGATPSP